MAGLATFRVQQQATAQYTSEATKYGQPQVNIEGGDRPVAQTKGEEVQHDRCNYCINSKKNPDERHARSLENFLRTARLGALCPCLPMSAVLPTATILRIS